jgi:hypothetical protein
VEVETHLQYAQRVGPPRVVACDIDLGRPGWYVWYCRSHDYGFNKRDAALDAGLGDRCPMSRLEDYRARRWEAAGAR